MNCSIVSGEFQFCYLVLISACTLLKPVCKQGSKYRLVLDQSLFELDFGSHVINVDYSLIKSITTQIAILVSILPILARDIPVVLK